MMLGIWKNIEELEESINLDELELIVGALRDREYRQYKAMAAVQGIDIEDQGEKYDPVQEIKDKVAAQQSGKSEFEYGLDMIGLDVEIEE